MPPLSQPYLVIWLVTNALDTIRASLLGLMGLSSGTYIGFKFPEKN